ncbi:MAG: DedA family protein [Phycisphaerae bacterium]|nr:DedA family protein [Phycisphaerae bacterium]
MRAFVLATLVLAAGNEIDGVQDWMQQAFYPALLLILITASLGVPIPEDVPLIAAGVLIKTHPGIASWHGTLIVALIGIMIGDLMLYTLGKRWGPGVVYHRSVRWMITPKRFARVSKQFRRHGAWFCFFGRFFVGVRAVMCLTAGATRFPYWRFLSADFAGALLSVPFFVALGYLFADMIPTLREYVSGIQAILLGALLVATSVGVFLYKLRKERRVKESESGSASATRTTL